MKHVSNEQKADEICKRHIFDSNHFDCCMEMAQWKEKQLIDKCKEFCDRQTTGEYYNRREVFQIDKYIDDMINFIKGE